MKKRYPHKENVLLVNITRLGDMLQATPTIAGLKQENPETKITVLVEKQFEDVCHHIPNIDEVVSLDLGMTVRSLAREKDGIIEAYRYVSDTVKELREKKFDYCLNMSSSAYTALLLRLVGITRNGGWTSDDEGYRVIESDWAKLFATSVFHANRQYNSLNLVDVFRCSADVEKHPNQLLINVEPAALEYSKKLIAEAEFTNSGPLIAIQAGASQGKRQWAPSKFIELVKILTERHNARVVLVGSKKELSIIDPIKAGANNPNVFVAGGKTSIPQLTALLSICDILVTGDTGPMHINVAVGKPVVAMFLASAFGFETGPYSEGNIVLQPIIGCGPCNPNKPCARPDCHDQISPELVANLTMLRLKGDFKSVPAEWVDPKKLIVYRSEFDQYGFCNLKAITPNHADDLRRFRDAYRKMWLEDLGGFKDMNGSKPLSKLTVADAGLEGLQRIVDYAEQGTRLIQELSSYIKDLSAPVQGLSRVNVELSQLDIKIEEAGYNHQPLGPLARMFVFAKENISGTDALMLASQMGEIYRTLARRGRLLGSYFQTV